MGYSANPSMVRVDFFKQSGEWYTTEAVKWVGEWKGNTSIHVEFAKSLRAHFKDRPERLSDMDAVCLHPYRQNAHPIEHPIQLKRGEWGKD